ncbi:MAG: hypothetical protein KDN05_04905 [Verrucomicrobiae bacterium]|nr:hypothetical protein [Verrucomicrobiae bacterium]
MKLPSIHASGLIGFLSASGLLSAAEPQLLADPGFETTPEGPLATGTTAAGWEVQRTGRSVIRNQLVIRCVGGTGARSGKKAVMLGLPKETAGFEFVTLGQRLKLVAGKNYEASVWARWTEGPGEKPNEASPTSGTPSAIVSFWVRHEDGTGDFAGRDEWLFDNQWKQLRFRFRATHPDQRSLAYVSLLPNQIPRRTNLIVDDFLITEVPGETGAETRSGNLIKDGGFEAGETLQPPWHFANMGGDRIHGEVVDDQGRRFFRMAMNERTSNLESAQLWQHLALVEGCAYEITCRMRWDNRGERKHDAIVNFGIYHEASNTWYGPVDQVLKASDDWVIYRFIHLPPFGGPWKIYAQLNGWGNFGQGLTVSFDEFTCRAVEASK